MSDKSFENRIHDIKNDLYFGGGEAQAQFLLKAMMGGLLKSPDIDPSKVLINISQLINEYRSIIHSGGIVPVKSFTFGKEGIPYACLDKDLKFCVRHFKDKNWKDILYVFPYMNSTTAFDVSFKYETPFVPDI